MLDARVEMLMHRVVDGEATANEAAELHEMLECQPNLRAEFEELQRLSQVLEMVRDVDVPHGLARDIIESTRRCAGTAAPQPRGWWRIMAGFGQALRPRAMATFGLGLVAGVGLVMLLLGAPEGWRLREADGFGSIGGHVPAALDDQTLVLAGVAVNARVGQAGSHVVLDLEVRADPVGTSQESSPEISVEADAASLWVLGVEQRSAAHTAAAGVSLLPDRVVMRPLTWPSTEVVAYRVISERRSNETTAFRVSLRVAGQRVERALHAGPGRFSPVGGSGEQL